MKPVVAIVTRTHNRPAMLKRVLKTVQDQVFTDYHHIVVNDAGNAQDVEQAVAELAPDQRGRITIIHNTTSAGREAAVNPGLQKAVELGTRYTVILDDDDTWEPEFLATMVPYLNQHPEQIAAACNVMLVYEKTLGDQIIEQGRGPLMTDKTSVTLEDILQVNFVPPVSMLLRTSALEKISGWRPDLPVLADWDFLLKLLTMGPVGWVGDRLANWHHRPSTTGDMGNSVVVEADNHANYHAVIRDQYLRAALHDGDNGEAVARLGLPLLLGSYQHATQQQIKALRQTVSKLETQLSEANEQLSYAVRQINEVGTSLLHLHQRTEIVNQQLAGMGLRARARRLLGVFRPTR